MLRLVFALIFLGTNLLMAQNPCLSSQAFHIVVLGSSTAAGSGPSAPDSAWVNRYRKYLQQINPANQVTNLAQGGTTTYHIMPDWFSAPSGRPQRNTAKNVSQAIRLNADAIIVNMPSNDAANGFSVAEHLHNFRAIVATADSAGIPVWTCTTQPRNFNATKWQVQEDVRDSILQIFGARAIDFWTGLPSANNGILPGFDSGDGVHLNDAGHRLLFKRVLGKNIVSQLLDTLNSPDVFAFGLQALAARCGNTTDTFEVHISNAGPTTNYALPIKWELQGPVSTAIFYDTLRGGVSTCVDTLMKRAFNTSGGGLFHLRLSLQTNNDSITANDSLEISFRRTALPSLTGQDDSVCAGAKARLFASGGDTILWYDAQGNFLQFGDSLKMDSVTTTQWFRAQAARGPFHFSQSLFTLSNTNINFRGIMFSLVAQDSLYVDSLALKVQNAGTYELTAYYLRQNYKGQEQNASAWTLWGKDSISSAAPGAFASAHFSTLLIPQGDTLSIYLQMPNGVNLQYANQGVEKTFRDSLLNLTSGTGIGGHFGSTYFPRLFSGSIYYHHGFKPEGQCQRDTLLAAVVRPQPDILPDTLILTRGSGPFQRTLPTSFTNVNWSTGHTGHAFSLTSSDLQSCTWQIFWVSGVDNNGCFFSDTMRAYFDDPLSLRSSAINYLTVFPNPNKGQFYLENGGSARREFEIINGQGIVLWQGKIKPEERLQLNLPSGMYYIIDQLSSAFAGSVLVLKP